jgi:hypothetical protein
LIEVKSLKDILCVFAVRAFFLLISLPFYIIAILDSNIFHNR